MEIEGLGVLTERFVARVDWSERGEKKRDEGGSQPGDGEEHEGQERS